MRDAESREKMMNRVMKLEMSHCENEEAMR